MISRSGKGAWFALLACAALIVGAMAWLTREVVTAEAERSLAESRAELQERIRLSLWRMDTLAAGVMIEENQRLGLVGLDQPVNPLVRMRFRMGPDGEVRSQSSNPDDKQRLASLLSTSGKFANRFEMMCAAVDAGSNQWSANVDVQAREPVSQARKQSLDYQVDLNQKERAARGGAFNTTVGKTALANQVLVPQQVEPAEPMLAAAGLYQPVWIQGEAFLLRDMRAPLLGGVAAIEGAWLRSNDFRRMLLGEVSDLMPEADLEAVLPGADPAEALTLASFPWRLIPGEKAVPATSIRGPLLTSLVVGWVAVLAALLAGAALVRGVMSLSERRASFVSAVTHELRTPLTTFRLYSEMLDRGAVKDEAKRSRYFKTLRREADRLSHMVENVLGFSSIEKGSARAEFRDHSVASLLEGMHERLEERLAAEGMVLKLDAASDLVVKADAAAIEHILFNLIDNAAKYGRSKTSNEVALDVHELGNSVVFLVRDRGEGIASKDRRLIFRAFHKSAQAAAESRPGVGLGLALSRRLARQMGGELAYRDEREGACFALSLPKA